MSAVLEPDEEVALLADAGPSHHGERGLEDELALRVDDCHQAFLARLEAVVRAD